VEIVGVYEELEVPGDEGRKKGEGCEGENRWDDEWMCGGLIQKMHNMHMQHIVT
jgi:hypothetical protein